MSITLILLLTSCQSAGGFGNQPSKPAEEILTELKETTLLADASKIKKERGMLGKKGMLLGNACIKKNPREPACYYYRAMSTGIYYSAHILGYQEGIRQMIEDCEMVIRLDPKFDHGAAYRMIGALYTEIPPTSVRPGMLVRDLDKAKENLSKAIDADDQFPENHLYMTRALLVEGNYGDARRSLKTSKDLITDWKSHRDYNYWMDLIKEYEEELNKEEG